MKSILLFSQRAGLRSSTYQNHDREDSLLQREAPKAFLEINPKDARRLRVRDGSMVAWNPGGDNCACLCC